MHRGYKSLIKKKIRLAISNKPEDWNIRENSYDPGTVHHTTEQQMPTVDEYGLHSHKAFIVENNKKEEAAKAKQYLNKLHDNIPEEIEENLRHHINLEDSSTNAPHYTNLTKSKEEYPFVVSPEAVQHYTTNYYAFTHGLQNLPHTISHVLFDYFLDKQDPVAHTALEDIHDEHMGHRGKDPIFWQTYNSYLEDSPSITGEDFKKKIRAVSSITVRTAIVHILAPYVQKWLDEGKEKLIPWLKKNVKEKNKYGKELMDIFLNSLEEKKKLNLTPGGLRPEDTYGFGEVRDYEGQHPNSSVTFLNDTSGSWTPLKYQEHMHLLNDALNAHPKHLFQDLTRGGYRKAKIEIGHHLPEENHHEWITGQIHDNPLYDSDQGIYSLPLHSPNAIRDLRHRLPYLMGHIVADDLINKESDKGRLTPEELELPIYDRSRDVKRKSILHQLNDHIQDLDRIKTAPLNIEQGNVHSFIVKYWADMYRRWSNSSKKDNFETFAKNETEHDPYFKELHNLLVNHVWPARE